MERNVVAEGDPEGAMLCKVQLTATRNDRQQSGRVGLCGLCWNRTDAQRQTAAGGWVSSPAAGAELCDAQHGGIHFRRLQLQIDRSLILLLFVAADVPALHSKYNQGQGRVLMRPAGAHNRRSVV